MFLGDVLAFGYGSARDIEIETIETHRFQKRASKGFQMATLPDFIVGDAIASGEVEVILKGWKQPEGAVHLVTPPGRPRPARVEALAEFLTGHFAKARKKN
jgi:DNA-binding transcriptional LysR family regulator